MVLIYNHGYHKFKYCTVVYSHRVKAKSLQDANMFPKEFPIAPSFIPYALANVVLLSIIIGGPKRRDSKLPNRTFYIWGADEKFHAAIEKAQGGLVFSFRVCRRGEWGTGGQANGAYLWPSKILVVGQSVGSF
jgi:hypothetical protein